MRSKLVFAILIVTFVFVTMAIPASAAPAQQRGGWTSTNYVLIDGTKAGQQPTVVYSDIAGVQVTRNHDSMYIVKFVRPYRFLVATAYGICTEQNRVYCDDPEQGQGVIEYITWNPTLREWIIEVDQSQQDVMISLIVKP